MRNMKRGSNRRWKLLPFTFLLSKFLRVPIPLIW